MKLRIRESGPCAASNPFRFATKYTDIETGLVQYNLCYYSPSLGRFINRDPIEERGGLNLYAYVGNQVANKWDYLGLTPPDWWTGSEDDWLAPTNRRRGSTRTKPTAA